MSETTSGRLPAGRPGRRPAGRDELSWRTTVLALLSVVVLIAVPLVLTSRGSAFEGTDAQVTSLLEEQGAVPWFRSLIDLGSAELESGLFAVQAGVGGLVLGYVLGRLHRRHRSGRASAVDEPRPGGPAAGIPEDRGES